MDHAEQTVTDHNSKYFYAITSSPRKTRTRHGADSPSGEQERGKQGTMPIERERERERERRTMAALRARKRKCPLSEASSFQVGDDGQVKEVANVGWFRRLM
jgi:hypothetical protein